MQSERSRFSASLAVRLGGAVLLILLLAVITIIGVSVFVQQQSTQAEVINIAGRQRMLSQRIAKDALLAARGENAAFDSLIQGAELFDKSLGALRDGTVGAEDLPAMPPAPTQAVLDTLEEMRLAWVPISDNVDIIVSAEPNSGELLGAVNRIDDQNIRLLGTAQAVVEALEDAANDSIRNLQTFLIVVVILDVLAFGFVSYFIWRTLRQTGELADVMTAIEKGDLQARANVITHDELGDLAVAMNGMLDNTLTLVQSEEARKEIQDGIRNLLEEVSTVAEGDLTAEAEVTAGMTGAIADSFNFMIEQLREIIINVQDTTLQVSSAANEIQTTAEHLAQGSENQATQILDTSAAVDEMAVSIQQVNENAMRSAAISEQALLSAETGRERVDNSIDGMSRIRRNVQETSKRIKRLGESSQEIGDIVATIRSIAKRTSILALNASIQASRAGEAGRSFAVVAEEVERLAERSSNATQQIAQITSSIQKEIAEAVASMEATTAEVVNGTQLNSEVAETFSEIQNVSNQLASIISSTSLAVQQQARGSEMIARSMNDIAEITQQTASGTKEATISIASLAKLADELRASVSTFKISENGAYGN